MDTVFVFVSLFYEIEELKLCHVSYAEGQKRREHVLSWGVGGGTCPGNTGAVAKLDRNIQPWLALPVWKRDWQLPVC